MAECLLRSQMGAFIELQCQFMCVYLQNCFARLSPASQNKLQKKVQFCTQMQINQLWTLMLYDFILQLKLDLIINNKNIIRLCFAVHANKRM